MRRMVLGILLAVAVAVAVPGVVRGEESVGEAGLHSTDVPATDLAGLDAALDHAAALAAASSHNKAATLAALAGDAEIAARRAEARLAAEAGASDMRSFQLDAAAAEFERASTAWSAGHGALLDPAEFARLFLSRAKLAQIRHAPGLMKEEFERALPLMPVKALDPAAFSPEALAIFQQAFEAASSTPPSPASALALADVARRTGMAWMIGGDVRRRAGGFVLTLTVADPSGAAKSVNVELPAGAALDTALEEPVAKLLAAVRVPAAAGRVVAAVAGLPVAAAAVHPVPANALPVMHPGPFAGVFTDVSQKPYYQRWYVWAGAAGVVVAGVGLAASSSHGSSGGGNPGTGITLVIQK